MWEEEFSELAKRLKASEIRELLKVTQMPDIISLAGGLPNPKSFPVEIIKEITTKLLDSYGEKMLQYGSTEEVVFNGIKHYIPFLLVKFYYLGNMFTHISSLYVFLRNILHKRTCT